MLRAATLPKAWMAALSTVRVSWRAAVGVMGNEPKKSTICVYLHESLILATVA